MNLETPTVDVYGCALYMTSFLFLISIVQIDFIL